MLEKLTSQQEAQMAEVKNFWLDYIFSCKNSINKEECRIGVDFIYKLASKKEPVIVYVESPMGCQLAVAYLKEFVKQTNNKNLKMDSVWDSVRDSVRDSVWDSVRASVWDSVGASLWDSVRASVRASVGASVGASVWDSVWDSVGASLWDSVWDSVGASVWDSGIKFQPTSYNGNIGDYGWVSFYDFFTKIGVVNHDKFNQFRRLMLSGVYDMIQLEGFCIVSNMPDRIERDPRGRLHCDSKSAIHFRDGYELYYWHGVNIKPDWIVSPKSINKEEILSEKNAEKRRILREILGAKEYYNLISDGKGLTLLDEDTDHQGFPMRLYETSINDDLINKKVQFIEVVCPSTERIYNIYPPSQNCKNVWEAKADTFNNEPLWARHGDVGMVRVGESPNKPLIET